MTYRILPPTHWPLERFKKAGYNPREITDAERARIRRGIERYGHPGSLAARAEDCLLIGGHQRLDVIGEILQLHDPSDPIDAEWLAARNLPGGLVPVTPIEGLGDEEAATLNILLNNPEAAGRWDMGKLSQLLSEIDARGFDATLSGFDSERIREIVTWTAGDTPGAEEQEKKAASRTLAERFGVPPFSVLDARQGYWQERKRAWLSLGIESEIGRGENLLNFSKTVDIAVGGKGKRARASRKAADQRSNLTGAPKKPEWATETGTENMAAGTSIFDPVLCELLYRWFCPPHGLILDPFAGGSVRGIVAERLGRQYVGIDLRAEQVAANKAQAERICTGHLFPDWIEGDARDLRQLVPSASHDFLIACPPYFDLEHYSDDPRDLSNAGEYSKFLDAMRDILTAGVALLRKDRFAALIVGDIRDKKGNYRGLVSDIVALGIAAGLRLYNDAVLVTAVGSLPIRIGRAFQGTRKLGKTHQNVLLFVRGDAKKATEAIGEVDFGEPADLALGGESGAGSDALEEATV